MVHGWGSLLKAVGACLLVSGLILAVCTISASPYIHSLVRECNKRYVMWQVRDVPGTEGEHFAVYYQGGRSEAGLVLDVAEGFYPQVARDLKADVPGVTPVLVYQDMHALNRSFGWSGNVGTMGVYWAGNIRVLAPSSWISAASPAERKDVFIHSGPMAHEITHLFVDQLTGGKCPRWFNEGVAQYEEYRLTGFCFAQAALFDPAQAFTYEELAQFDALQEQNLAYHQTFSMVYFLVENKGWDAVRGVLAELGQGRSFGDALREHTGYDETALMDTWRDWLSTGQGIATW